MFEYYKYDIRNQMVNYVLFMSNHVLNIQNICIKYKFLVLCFQLRNTLYLINLHFLLQSLRESHG